MSRTRVSAPFKTGTVAGRAGAQAPRVIKKYPNRRLYDTDTSAYITPMFTEAVLANIIRFYGHAMQGFMGSYLEKNVQAFMDIQAKLAEQSQGLTPEMWSQFMRLQSPVMQGVMGNYLEQSKAMFLQLQEQMTKQTEQVLGAFGIKR